MADYSSSDDEQKQKAAAVDSLVEKLEEFCSSDELSLNALRDKIRSIPVDALQNSYFFHDACNNARVSLEIVEFLLENFPGAARATVQYGDDNVGATVAYPLHLACYNLQCPSSVIALLLKRNPSAISHLCIVEDGVPSGEYDGNYVMGLPLHYYLGRKSNIDIGIVRVLVDA